MATSIRLKRLRIEKLFDSHDVDIAFRLDERVTVLHGRNGSGKTVTLKLIAALWEGRYAELGRYPFERLVLELTDGSILTVEKQVEEGVTTHAYQLRRPETEGASGLLDGLDPAVPEGLEQMLRETGIRRFGPSLWQDLRTGTVGSIEMLSERHQRRLRRWLTEVEESSTLNALREALPKVKFIETDRLFVRGGIPVEENEYGAYREVMEPSLMVERLSREIKAIVQEADKEYRLISTKLDSSLRQRIFHPPENPPSLQELVERNKTLRDREARLQSLGLLRESPGAMDQAALTNEQQRGMFHILLDDLSQKLAPFADLSGKAERLLKSLNTKLAPKQVRLDVETGYQIIAASGKPLPLDRLSSGEQHELVLLHELLFDLAPGTLILIDEPELSLHVTWQQTLVPELMEIAQLSQLDFVLATHSPFIVGDDHAHLMVRLGEPQP